MRTAKAVFVVALTLVAASAVADPGAAIGAARQAMNNKQYDQAVQLLQNAVPEAAAMNEPQRSQAMAALHFYTALAFHGMGDVAKTHETLEQFFHFSPNTTSIDAKKYDAGFVKTFSEVLTSLKKEASSNFETVYAGYRTFSEAEPKPRPLEQWGNGPELLLLGTVEEKAEWRRLRDDDERRRFIDAFWQKRDRNPDTPENEYKTEFLRRAAFADVTFPSEKMRGSVTDRGRVFVLLGPPRVIRQKPLSAREGATTAGRRAGPVVGMNTPSDRYAGMRAMEASDRALAHVPATPAAKGKVERWIFSRDQLPKSIPDAEIVFKFVSEEGYGEGVLQREFLVNKVLHDAAVLN